MACTTKDVRKGTHVILRNGWAADVLDNLTNRATRMCKVYYGPRHAELGSVYSTDIVEAFVDGNWEFVQHSPAALKLMKQRQAWGF